MSHATLTALVTLAEHALSAAREAEDHAEAAYRRATKVRTAAEAVAAALVTAARKAARGPTVADIETTLDEVIGAHDRLVCRQIDAGACRTGYDYKRRDEAERAFHAEREAFLAKVSTALGRSESETERSHEHA